MKADVSFDRHMKETAFVFLTIFSVIHVLPEGRFKKRCQYTAAFFCAVRVILALLILLPEEVSKDVKPTATSLLHK
ncbi:hypothetical protein [Alicyclobacillus acidiphilus]|nr:hypothetical protein [Alicyclobacillus acidiphilus]